MWATSVSYAVSYFFITIVWVNHHHLPLSPARGSPFPSIIWCLTNG